MTSKKHELVTCSECGTKNAEPFALSVVLDSYLLNVKQNYFNKDYATSHCDKKCHRAKIQIFLASLSTKEPPGFTLSSPGISAFAYMNENLGRIVSQFVEKRIDGPQTRETDLWCEAVYAALFSVALEVVIRLKSAIVSPDDLEQETKAIIEGTWMKGGRL